VNRKTVPMLLAVSLLGVGCSPSEPQIIDESKYEDLYDDEQTDSDDTDSSDDAEPNDDSDGFDDEGFPDPPQLPDAVKDESEDGAVAGAEFFMDAYEHAYRTTDNSALKRISGDECEPCKELIDRFDGFDQTMIAKDASFTQRNIVGSLSDTDGTYVSVETRAIDFHVANADKDSTEAFESTDYTFVFLMDRKDSQWFVTGADFQKSADLD